MKKNKLLTSFYLMLLVISMGTIYGQKKSQASKQVFGQTINPININPENQLIRCSSTEYENYLQKKNPKRLTLEQFESWITPIIENQEKESKNNRSPHVIYNIPVVIHVIHNGDAINTVASHSSENISDAQAISQITVLNQDYRRMINTRGHGFTGYGRGVDCEINFVLAKKDPHGITTNGIDRVNLRKDGFTMGEIDSMVKPLTIWDPTKYLNMWTVKFSDSGLLGYAQFPSNSGLKGLDEDMGEASTDGVVAGYDAFGSKDLDDGSFVINSTYAFGRTMTHEVGHFLGLRHIWGDDNKCTGSNPISGDYLTDTPDSNKPNYACTVVSNCVGNDMIENYMDYTDDACMNTFTMGQKTRMNAVLTNSPRRKELNSSDVANVGTVYNQDAEIKFIQVTPKGCDKLDSWIKIQNKGNTTLTAMTISYKIDNLPAQTYNWTGSLLKGEQTDINLSNIVTSGGQHTFKVEILNVNGVADQNLSSNVKTSNYTSTTTQEITFNEVVFNLQLDEYGSETTWSLKNSQGTTLHRGGPYTDSNSLPALKTFNWTLSTSECYILTINDSEGDGLCCDYGAGYYNLKSRDGNTIIASGGEFASKVEKGFRTNVILGLEDFATSSGVYIYPNPAKEKLNIYVSKEIGLPTKYSIINNIGQTIIENKISKENDLEINTALLSKGSYFIKIEKEDVSKILKFIKQ